MKTTRLRSRSSKYVFRSRYSDGRISDSFVNYDSEIFTDVIGNRSGENPCKHISVVDTYSGEFYSSSGVNYSLHGYSDAEVAGRIFDKFVMPAAMSQVYFPLDFQRNNKFNILVTLGELDETLLIFSRKFWQQLTYGSVNWGLLPFYSDLKSLVASLDDIMSSNIQDELSNKLQMNKFFNTYPITANGSSYLGGSTSNRWEFEGHAYINGYCQLDLSGYSSKSLALSLLADEIGFNPDLGTIWDLLPLSFVVDYFIPVSDSLDAVHPRGWFKPSTKFTGTFSVGGTLKYNRPLSNTIQNKSGFAECTVYERKIDQSLTFGGTPPKEIGFSAPSFRNIADSAYIALTSRNKSRKPKRLA